jgi:hypothetical protein
MAKIAPMPNDAGFVVPIACGNTESEKNKAAEEENLRILSQKSPDDENNKRKQWIIPAEEKLELLFFRKIFTNLRKQLTSPEQVPSASPEDVEGDDNIPIEMFQRAFERLFYVLEDEAEASAKGPFDAQQVDRNGNGFVGWVEFHRVYKESKISIKLSLPERIYLTLDNPDCSHIASIMSFFVLLTITVSSIFFILSTTPEFQDETVDMYGRATRKPKSYFPVIENVCLAIFVIEYFMRLCTCWAVRDEAFDRKRLLEITIGSQSIQASYPAGRLLKFVLAPSNIIDLLAIGPGMIGIMSKLAGGGGLEGGGFVVLRLVRLTRIFRAFKNPKLVEPVIVIARTMQESTKALYVLGFNLLLGILISGSLMWLCEGGDWQPDGPNAGTYQRVVARNGWRGEVVKAESPFLSIPHAFWWAVVTAMTVGYGDMYPTTSAGYVIATATMVFSLVILALPVGVIGGNFSQEWNRFEMEKQASLQETEKDKQYITASIQKIDPFEMSKILFLEVWHERCPLIKGEGVTEKRPRPDNAEFLGQVDIRLELGPQAVSKNLKDLTLRKQNSDNGGTNEVSGTITVNYEWIPDTEAYQEAQRTVAYQEAQRTRKANSDSESEIFASMGFLRGRLRVTLVSANNLMILSYHKAGNHTSNPYVMVFAYPSSPANGEMLCPQAWRSPTAAQTIDPKWNAHYSWAYRWDPDRENLDAEPPCSMKIHPDPMESTGDALREAAREDEVKEYNAEILKALQRFGKEVSQLRDEVRNVSGRMNEHKIKTLEN